MSSEGDQTLYKVVVNHEEQYSIWPVECLAYIEETWTDMRPLSLRKRMEEQRNKP